VISPIPGITEFLYRILTVQGVNIKGHIIIAPVPIGGTGALICYINPQVGPRDALFTVQSFALKLQNLI